MSEILISDYGKEAKTAARPAGRFCVLDREIWSALWTAPTVNRLNLVTAFLVLLAGTGGDNRTTKWSARACEERAGLGKPRAKIAITELISAGLVEHTDASSAMHPQYRLSPPDRHKDPIFLPVEFVTGLTGETPVLRRLREVGDPLLLRMVVDLYGLVEVDAPFGVPLSKLKQYDSDPNATRKVLETGAHAAW